jgi:hypothetical protein
LAAGLGDGWLGLDVAGLDVGALDVGALGVGSLGVAALGVLLEVVALGVPLAEAVGVAGRLAPAENDGGVVGGVLDEQADTDTAASMAKAAQPSTVPRRRRRPSK